MAKKILLEQLACKGDIRRVGQTTFHPPAVCGKAVLA